MNRLEQLLQKAVVQLLQLLRPRAIWLHPPNGVMRSRKVAAIYQGMGVRAGAADLLFIVTGAAMELKSDKGSPSPAQRQFQADCGALGIPYAVVRSVDEAQLQLETWGLVRPRRETMEALTCPAPGVMNARPLSNRERDAVNLVTELRLGPDTHLYFDGDNQVLFLVWPSDFGRGFNRIFEGEDPTEEKARTALADVWGGR